MGAKGGILFDFEGQWVGSFLKDKKKIKKGDIWGVHKISALKPNHQSKCMMYF